MALTPIEEDKLKKVLAVEKARKDLDAKNKAMNEEIRAALSPVRAQIEANYATELSALETAYNNAVSALDSSLSTALEV